MDRLQNIREKLQDIRERKDLKLRKVKYLKETFTDFDGQEKPLNIRYYQIQGAFHLLLMKRFVLGDDTGLGKCVTGDTLLVTDRGLIPIKDLAPKPLGELQAGRFYRPKEPIKVWTGRKWARVRRFYYDGFRNTKRVTTRCGFSVEGSLRHPLQTSKGWKKLSDLQVGDNLRIRWEPTWREDSEKRLIPFSGAFHPNSETYEIPDRMTPGLARLLGYITAEGRFPDRHTTIVSPDDPEICRDIRRLFKEIFGWEGDRKNKDDSIKVPSIHIRAFLGECGIGRESSAEKRVPPLILQSGMQTAREFLRGYFECRGSVVAGGVEISSSSERLVREVQLLLLRWGIIGMINPESAKDRESADWRLVVSGEEAVRFHSRVGFIDKRKMTALQQEIRKIETQEPDHNNVLDIRGLTDILCENRLFDPVIRIEDGFSQVMDIEVADPDHSFVGNGLVNHNTLETIVALSCIWEKDPTRKAIILTTKSAVRQWRNEFSKFTRGVRVIVSQGTPAQRRKARELWESSAGPTALIMGYRSAVQDISQIQDWKDFIFIADECFDYSTPVTLSDGSTEPIGRIVTRKMPVEVLSRCPVTKNIESRKVVNWFRNPIRKDGRKSLLKMTFRFSNSVRVTPSHNFFTPEGKEIPAGKLQVGSKITHLCRNTPSEDQMQVILGGLLGNSSILHPRRKLWEVSFAHPPERGRYLRFKRDILSSLGVSDIDDSISEYQPQGGKKIPVERFRLNGNAAVTSALIQSRIWKDGKKRITADWLDNIGPLGLAVWYADNGSLDTYKTKQGVVRHQIALNIQGFGRDEQKLLAGWLRRKWGIEARIKTLKGRSDGEDDFKKSCPYLYLSEEAACDFLGLMPGAIPGVEHKFPGMKTLDTKNFDTEPGNSLVVDWVTSKKSWVPSEKQRYVYNIEVEGNHNYFAGGSLVANCTAFKNPKTHVHRVCHHLAGRADRVWGLTATLIKNNLMEGYGIYRVVMPGLFPMSRNRFMLYYCLTRMQRLPRSNRQIPVIVGYLPQRIKEFREVIDPYFIGRPKHEVASELPVLVTRLLDVPITEEQEDKYGEALNGLLELGTGDDAEIKEVTKLTAIAYCQEIVNDLGLIGCPANSPKVDVIIDLLTEGDFAEENIIIFSRFKKMIDILMPVLKKNKIHAVRITGDEDEKQREEAKNQFQDPNHKVRVACITTAGSEAINLQAAKALICIDTPWSAGDFLQLVGRMVRIGSVHDRCYVIHLIARRKMGSTIDHRVMEVLRGKMDLINAVIGKRLKGEDDTTVIDVQNDISLLFESLRKDARKETS